MGSSLESWGFSNTKVACSVSPGSLPIDLQTLICWVLLTPMVDRVVGHGRIRQVSRWNTVSGLGAARWALRMLLCLRAFSGQAIACQGEHASARVLPCASAKICSSGRNSLWLVQHAETSHAARANISRFSYDMLGVRLP